MSVRMVDQGGRVLVIGAGLMGSGIATVVALSGRSVTLFDVSQAALEAGGVRSRESLARLVRRGTVEDSAATAATERITISTELETSAREADLVIESVVEDLEVKQTLFGDLDRWCAPDVLLATNTSQFQIGRIARHCQRPGRVIGMHWSNPPVLMQLVELVLSAETAEDTLSVATEFVTACDRQVVVCRKDVPGFISNRLSTVLFMEGARLVDEGIASAAEVDAVAKLMFGHRMGPLETLDLAGLDTALKTSSALDVYYGGDRFAPPAVLRRLVDEGRLGRKTGSGFYEVTE